MDERKEIRAKSLEIAALILGSCSDSPLDKYLSLAQEVKKYIEGSPDKSTVGTAKTTGL
jgi:hypothetical protein